MMTSSRGHPHGTGAAAAQLKHPLGGKTGTTSDYTDAWFLGFSPSVTCGVWVGYDSRQSLGDKETGARAALPIWMDVMKVAIAGKDNEQFIGQRKTPADQKNPAAASRHPSGDRQTGVSGFTIQSARSFGCERRGCKACFSNRRQTGVSGRPSQTALRPGGHRPRNKAHSAASRQAQCATSHQAPRNIERHSLRGQAPGPTASQARLAPATRPSQTQTRTRPPALTLREPGGSRGLAGP